MQTTLRQCSGLDSIIKARCPPWSRNDACRTCSFPPPPGTRIVSHPDGTPHTGGSHRRTDAPLGPTGTCCNPCTPQRGSPRCWPRPGSEGGDGPAPRRRARSICWQRRAASRSSGRNRCWRRKPPHEQPEECAGSQGRGHGRSIRRKRLARSVHPNPSPHDKALVCSYVEKKKKKLTLEKKKKKKLFTRPIFFFS